MKFIYLIALNLLFINVNGQISNTCKIGDYLTKDKNKNGQSIISEIFINNLDSLTKDFKKKYTVSIRFYCYVNFEFKDSVIKLNTDKIIFVGKNPIDNDIWKIDFEDNVKSIIKKFEPYILKDSLINSDCKTLFFKSMVTKTGR